MSKAVEALDRERKEVLRIGAALDARDWEAPSGCAGWSTKDVVSHMATLYWTVVDVTTLPDAAGLGTEATADLWVTSRREMTGPQVLDDYAAVSEQALAVLEVIDGVDDEMDLGDLGTYPARVLPTAFCFDHYTHIRADLFGPRGSLPGPVPPTDTLRLVPVLEWIEAAVPQQNRALFESEPFGAADIIVDGTDRTLRIGDPTAPPAATVHSDPDTLVRWITQRGDWCTLDVDAAGDPATLDVLQRIKVF